MARFVALTLSGTNQDTAIYINVEQSSGSTMVTKYGIDLELNMTEFYDSSACSTCHQQRRASVIGI